MQIFRSESNIKKATYLSRRESFLSSKDTYLSSRDIYLSGGKNIVEKRRLILSCVRALMKVCSREDKNRNRQEGKTENSVHLKKYSRDDVQVVPETNEFPLN